MKSMAMALLALLVFNTASAATTLPYYGQEFYRDLQTGTSNEQLIQKLHKILHSGHHNLGYDRARIFMMGVFYLVKDGNSYALPDVYCDRLKTAKEFPSSPPAPRQIPLGTVLNTEHTWPQSKFTGKFDRELQKSDLHHLFPTDTQLNSDRGNMEFGEVVKDTKRLKCPESRLGLPANGHHEVFEPPQHHKGNVARALFYFSVAYRLPISDQQESALRKWHQEDPVDEEEARRNTEIHKIQGNRNPFIDHPELADRINNF